MHDSTEEIRPEKQLIKGKKEERERERETVMCSTMKVLKKSEINSHLICLILEKTHICK